MHPTIQTATDRTRALLATTQGRLLVGLAIVGCFPIGRLPRLAIVIAMAYLLVGRRLLDHARSHPIIAAIGSLVALFFTAHPIRAAGVLGVVVLVTRLSDPPTTEARQVSPRRWHQACAHAGITGPMLLPRGRRAILHLLGEEERADAPVEASPDLTITETRTGLLRGLVTLLPGQTLDDLTRAAPALASALDARQVVVQPGDTARLAIVTILWSNPFDADTAPEPEPQPSGIVLPGAPAHAYEPIRQKEDATVYIGVTETGQAVNLTLFERSLLLGGSPGSGKSVTMRRLLLSLSRQPEVVLVGIDPKRVELAVFRPRFSRLVSDLDVSNPEPAITLLQQVVDEMNRRYLRLEDAGRQVITPGPAIREDGQPNEGLDDACTYPIIVLVIDEISELTSGLTDRKAAKTVDGHLRNLMQKGRAAGIVLVGATQKPSSDVVPTSIRDLFAYRLAHRCGTDEQSDTILGSGKASAGYSAEHFSPSEPGVGWLLGESDRIPQRIQTKFATAEEARAQATMDAHLAPSWPLQRTTVPDTVADLLDPED